MGDKYAARMHTNILSMSLGAHVPFNQSFILGGAVNYDRDHLHFAQGGNSSWNIWQGAVYTILQQPIGYIFVDGMAGSGFGKLKRDIHFSIVDRTAKSKPSTHQGFLYTEFGTNFACGHALFQPYFAGEYAYYKMKEITETGADSLNLRIAKKTTNTVDSYLGLRMTTMLGCNVTVSADMAWHHRYGPDRFNVTNQFIAFCNPFDIKGSKIGTDAAEGSVSITGTFCEYLDLFVEVAGERWAGWGAYSVDFGVSLWW
jgi:outer membrane autotransporter protein